jgi:hypothetical protein
LEDLRRQLEENQKAMDDLEKTWQQRLEEERKKACFNLEVIIN